MRLTEAQRRTLAETIARVVEVQGRDSVRSQQARWCPRKLLDVSRLHGLGWQASIPMEDGLRGTCQWFFDHQIDYRGSVQ